jgi:hypothetical protein
VVASRLKASIRLNGIESLATMATAIMGEGVEKVSISVILSRNEAASPHGRRGEG